MLIRTIFFSFTLFNRIVYILNAKEYIDHMLGIISHIAYTYCSSSVAAVAHPDRIAKEYGIEIQDTIISLK